MRNFIDAKSMRYRVIIAAAITAISQAALANEEVAKEEDVLPEVKVQASNVGPQVATEKTE